MEQKTTKLFKDDILAPRDTAGRYTDLFREKAFLVWYTNGRITITDVIAKMDLNGLAPPSVGTIQQWKKDDKWDERADELDLRVREEVEQRLVSEKAAMQARHAEIGRQLYKQGIELIEQMGLHTPHQALRAIELGIGIENDATSLEKILKAVSQMDDPKVVAKASQLLSKVKLKNDPDA